MISVTEEGISICFNDLHSMKVSGSILVTEEGVSNVICSNDEHLEKVPDPISVTEEGINICVNDEHPMKA